MFPIIKAIKIILIAITVLDMNILNTVKQYYYEPGQYTQLSSSYECTNWEEQYM